MGRNHSQGQRPFYQHTHNAEQPAVRITVVPPTSFDFGWHYHDSCELVFIEAGNGQLLIGDWAAAYSAGQLLVIGQHLPHAFVASPDSHINTAQVLQFDPDWITSLLSLPEFHQVKQLMENMKIGIQYLQSPLTIADFTELQQLTGIGQISQSLSLLGKVARCQDYQLIGGNNAKQPAKSRVARICAFIDEHLAEPLSHQRIADALSVSSSHLARLFKQQTGYSLTDYIIRRRMQYAMRQLADTDLSIATIAEQCGYQQDAFFSRAFRQFNGQSPSAYRQHARNNT